MTASYDFQPISGDYLYFSHQSEMEGRVALILLADARGFPHARGAAAGRRLRPCFARENAGNRAPSFAAALMFARARGDCADALC
jgi:hypothetical protein